jgi:uncharacterized protein
MGTDLDAQGLCHAAIIASVSFNSSGLHLMTGYFHFSFHVADLDQARQFYGQVLGCAEGRSAATWVDFNFFGHQLSLHVGTPLATTRTGRVGEHQVPMPHFGIILDLPRWQQLAKRLTSAGMSFIIAPTVRFAGEPGEQRTMFFTDPSGNAIEVKGFKDLAGHFAN